MKLRPFGGPPNNPGPPIDNVGWEDEQLQADIDGRTMVSPPLLPQRYIRPIAPIIDGQFLGSGVNEAAQTNVERGDEAHGVDIDSHVGPKDISEDGDRHHLSDTEQLVMPEDSNIHDQEYPVPVRIVSLDPIEDVEILIERFNVAANTGPVKLLSKDRKRIKAHVCTLSVSGTTAPSLIAKAADNPFTAGYPLANFTNGSQEINATNELWVIMSNVTDSYIVSVYIERRRNADPHNHD